MTDPLFPPIEPYMTDFLKVDDIHTLYYEQSGNPEGMPILFVHGGPGAPTLPSVRQFFDPSFYRIIVFHQRGSGNSTPLAETRQNTTQLLISDMELLRETVGVEKWHLFGGSWGSTLSLAYAEAHPERCLSLILRGIFLCRDEEIKWFYDKSKIVYPDYFADYESVLPEEDRQDHVKGFHKLLTSADEKVRLKAAQAWSCFEAKCSTLYYNKGLVDLFAKPEYALPMACIENHYFMNNIFMEKNQLLNNAHKLKNIPVWIVHGRYDIVCPLKNAFDLKEVVPHAELTVVADGAHAPFEPSMAKELLRCTTAAKKILPQ